MTSLILLSKSLAVLYHGLTLESRLVIRHRQAVRQLSVKSVLTLVGIAPSEASARVEPGVYDVVVWRAPCKRRRGLLGFVSQTRECHRIRAGTGHVILSAAVHLHRAPGETGVRRGERWQPGGEQVADVGWWVYVWTFKAVVKSLSIRNLFWFNGYVPHNRAIN